MPRRNKPYVGPNKTVVNGGRYKALAIGDEGIPVDSVPDGPIVEVPEINVNLEDIRKKVATHIDGFDELAHLKNRDQFIDDLTHECARTRALGLDHLTKGSRSKPDEWSAQILARGIAAAMERHGVTPTVSEYDDGSQIRRSLYLRLIPGLSKISGCAIPTDVKGHALRAKRIVRQDQ